jgi:PTS system ascorbate-specific IIA component
MIGLLLVAHGRLGDSLIECAAYVHGRPPDGLQSVDLNGYADADTLLRDARARIDTLDAGQGVLVMTDIYGATPSNTACKLVQPGRVEVVAGVNLPMLLKALNYRETLALPQLIERIVEGGRNSINHISETMCHAATGR